MSISAFCQNDENPPNNPGFNYFVPSPSVFIQLPIALLCSLGFVFTGIISYEFVHLITIIHVK